MAQSEAHQTSDLRVVGSSPATLVFCSLTHTRSTKKVHPPGLEPGSPPWKGGILPLDHECYCIVFLRLLLFPWHTLSFHWLTHFVFFLLFSHTYLPPTLFFPRDPIVQMVGHLPYSTMVHIRALLSCLLVWWEDAGSTPAGIFFFHSVFLTYDMSDHTWHTEWREYSLVGRA